MVDRLSLHETQGGVCLRPHPDGGFVRYTDYEALEARCREMEVERDFWIKKARELARKSDNAQSHAQKLREALLDAQISLDPAMETQWWKTYSHLTTLALTPMSVLAAVRDEVREECAVICEKYQYPSEEAAAIRARKETGE